MMALGTSTRTPMSTSLFWVRRPSFSAWLVSHSAPPRPGAAITWADFATQGSPLRGDRRTPVTRPSSTRMSVAVVSSAKVVWVWVVR